VSERVGECVSGLMSEWVSGRVSGCVRACLHGWASEWVDG
jgi:hypothetical protein